MTERDGWRVCKKGREKGEGKRLIEENRERGGGRGGER